MRVGEQPIDELFVSIRARVVDEGVNFLWRRREPDQVQMRPSNQRITICFRRRFKSILLQFREDERIDRISDPLLLFQIARNFRQAWLDEGPVRWSDFT